jgi:hypothetical protein
MQHIDLRIMWPEEWGDWCDEATVGLAMKMWTTMVGGKEAGSITVTPCPAAEMLAKLERMVRAGWKLNDDGKTVTLWGITDEGDEIRIIRPTLTEAIAAVEET